MKWGVTICTLACVLNAAGDWPNPLGPAYTGVQKGSGFPIYWSRADGVVWQVSLPHGPATSVPITVGSQILLTTSNASGDETLVISYDGKSGRLQWSKSWRSISQVSLAADQQLVVVAEESGVIHCFNLEGELLWEKKHPAHVKQLLVEGGNVFLLTLQDSAVKLTALTGKQGKEIWSQNLGTPAKNGGEAMTVVPSLGHLLVATANGVSALDPKNGKNIWQIPDDQLLGKAGQVSLSGDGSVLIRDAQESVAALYVATAKGLQLSWKTQTAVTSNKPHFVSHTAGVVLLDNQRNELELLDRKTGNKRYGLRLPDGKYATLLATSNLAYSYSEDREVVVIDLTDGKVLSRTLMADVRKRAGVQGLAFLHDRLVVSDGLMLYCVTGTKVGSRAEEGSPSGNSPIERVGAPATPGRRLPL